MAEQVLLIERADGIATLTMNRPDARNALNGALRSALLAAFRELAADASVRAVILTGAGKAFSAGLDLKEMGERGPGAGDSTGGSGGINYGLVETIERFPHPVIGAINGFAITGGFELALQASRGSCHPEDHPCHETDSDDRQRATNCLLRLEAQSSWTEGERSAGSEGDENGKANASPDK